MTDDKLYEGKAKVIFPTDDPDVLRMYFKDDATAFNGIKKGVIGGKGHINCVISTVCFKLLENAGVATHFVERAGEAEMLVKRLDMAPVEVVLRNVVAGSLAKRLGLEEGASIPNPPVVELYYKSDELNDPPLDIDHVRAFEMWDVGEVEEMKRLGIIINSVLVDFFKARDITLVDFKVEFGRDKDGNLVLGDEITPDGCRLWEVGTNRKMDKDRFRRDLGDVEETYLEVLARVTSPSAEPGPSA